MHMDCIKLFAKREKELEILIQTIRIHSQDIGMELYDKIEYSLMLKTYEKNNVFFKSREKVFFKYKNTIIQIYLLYEYI